MIWKIWILIIDQTIRIIMTLILKACFEFAEKMIRLLHSRPLLLGIRSTSLIPRPQSLLLKFNTSQTISSVRFNRIIASTSLFKPKQIQNRFSTTPTLHQKQKQRSSFIIPCLIVLVGIITFAPAALPIVISAIAFAFAASLVALIFAFSFGISLLLLSFGLLTGLIFGIPALNLYYELKNVAELGVDKAAWEIHPYRNLPIFGFKWNQNASWRHSTIRLDTNLNSDWINKLRSLYSDVCYQVERKKMGEPGIVSLEKDFLLVFRYRIPIDINSNYSNYYVVE